MNLTNLFVELIITGFHTSLWIGFIVITFINYDTIDISNLFNMNKAVPLVALAYIIGTVVDRITDIIFMPKDHKIRNKYLTEELPSYITMRFFILHKSKDIYYQLEYTRSRLRIVRSAVLNFALTTVTLIPFEWFQLFKNDSIQFKIFIFALTFTLGSFLSYICYVSWSSLTKSYVCSVIAAFKMLSEEK